MMMSAFWATSAVSSTVKPAASASRQALQPGYSATSTLQPLSLQVQRVGVPLAAVADDADGLVLEQGQVGVLVVVALDHQCVLLLLPWPASHLRRQVLTGTASLSG